jgi:hypothetical protein
VITTGRGFSSMRTTVAIVVGTWILIGILLGVGFAANNDPSKSRYYISPTPVSLFDELDLVSGGSWTVVLVLVG